AAELVALAPDAIVATGISTVGPLLQLTRTVPIVFPAASDPVAAGLVESLARPGGNVTGFLSFEYSLRGKWPELLRQVAPSVRRAAVLRDPANPSAIAQFGVIQAVASSVRWRAHTERRGQPDPRDPAEIEAWKGRDPITRLERQLRDQGHLDDAGLRSMEAD